MLRSATVATIGLSVTALVLPTATHTATTAPPVMSAPPSRAVEAAERFLRRYVEPDGRVARHDQGSDTVGEGQSYGLVLALVADDDATFTRIWAWTQDRLQRPDGLLAHRATADGQIVDDDAATDADVVTAWALLRRGGRFTADGRALAGAVLALETIDVPGTGPLLAAGPWATGAPGSLNPSYWVFPLVAELESLTGDAHWGAVHDASLLALRNLTGDGTRLPPDWVRADGPGLTATPAPGGDVPDVRYSLDAQRVPVWLASSDRTRARDLAAAWWRTLQRPRVGRALALGLDGAPLDEAQHPLSVVAAAASAFAAGDDGAGSRLLRRAQRLDARSPTYYGAAWVALGYALLTDERTGESR